MQPIIAHLDMNSYFASVEQQDNLGWRGKPVGVCEHLGGIIIAASVEAKKWGIKTGTPVWEAKKLYPKIILTPTHPERYRFYTRRFLKVVGDYTDKVEKYSIDECFLDLTKFCNIRYFPLSLRVQPKQSYLSEKIASSSVKALTPRNDTRVNPFEEAVNIAREIKRRFKTEVGDWLRCSIGIADNKVLAKIASDLKKPDGLVVVSPNSIVIPSAAEESLKIVLSEHKGSPSAALRASPSTRSSSDALVGRDDRSKATLITKAHLYQQLKLTDVPGIGRRQERNLNELGIKTLSQLRDFPKSHLLSRFGRIMGHHLHHLGQLKGTWKAAVEQDNNIKSMGHMCTLPQEFRKPEFFVPVLYKLCEMVGRRLRKQGLMGNVVHFYYHDKNYEGFGKSLKLGYFLQDGREIFLECARTMGKLPGRGEYHPPATEFKLVGVTVADLRPYVPQLSLFGDIERQQRLVLALDEINDKYGEFTILRALQMPAGKAFRDSIGFGRMKEL